MSKSNRGFGSIYRRGRTYWIKYYVCGQSKRESARTDKYEQAAALLKRRLAASFIPKTFNLGVQPITMRDILLQVELDYEENNRRSLPQLRSRLPRLLSAFGSADASMFGTDDIKRYRAERRHSGASQSTINRELEILSRAWNLAMQAEPPKVSRPLRVPMYEEDNIRTTFLEDEHFRAVHDSLPDYVRALFVVAYSVPCRRGELMRLRFQQLDFANDEIVLRPGTTKNKAGRRMPIFGMMKEALLMQRTIRDAAFPTCEYVFFNEAGERLVDFRRAWAKACTAAGVAGLRFHDLRRTAARNMRRAGIAEHVIMTIGGWTTNSMFRRYDIIDGRDIKEAGRKMEEAMGTILGTTHSEVPCKPEGALNDNAIQ